MDFIWKWAVNKFKDYVVKNWATTLAGLVGAVLVQVPALAPHKDAIIAAAIALVGLLAKQATTSGTTEQPRTPPEVVEAQTSALRSGVSAVSVVAGPLNDEEERIIDQLRAAGG